MSNRIEKLRQLPVVKNLLEERYRRYFQAATECHLFRGVYASFADAAASIPVHRRSGYDQPEPASMYQDELGELRPTDYPVLFWLDRLLPATTSLVDFGGHVGVKYYAFSKYLSIPESYSWTVCDVPAVAAAGAELATREGAPIKFVSSLRDAGAHDILFCSGSLQYLGSSLAGTTAARRARSRFARSTRGTSSPGSACAARGPWLLARSPDRYSTGPFARAEIPKHRGPHPGEGPDASGNPLVCSRRGALE